MKLIEKLTLVSLAFRIRLKQLKITIAALLVIVTGSAVFTWLLAPQIPYTTMMSVLTALIQFAGILIAFTAVVAIQVLAVYRSQLERASDKNEVLERRGIALLNLRASAFCFISGVLSAVILMAWLKPEFQYYSTWGQALLLGLF